MNIIQLQQCRGTMIEMRAIPMLVSGITTSTFTSNSKQITFDEAIERLAAIDKTIKELENMKELTEQRLIGEIKNIFKL